MLKEEAEWISSQLDYLEKENILIYPVANIGSSDESHYELQPWIKTLSEKIKSNGIIKNIDIKDTESVDLVGDLLDDNFINDLKKEKFQLLICANVLTNIADKDKFAKSLIELMPTNSILMVSVSNRYPYVADPVDTLYRPTPEELCELFPSTEILNASLVSSDSFVKHLWQDKKAFFITFFRLFVPFYKPKTWWNLVKYLPKIHKPVRASCALLKKAK